VKNCVAERIDAAASCSAMRTQRFFDRAAVWTAGLYALLACAGYAAWKRALAERSGDPAEFENMLWNASHGHGLQTALEGGVNHLAVHWSPILYVLVPLYRATGSLHIVHALVAVGVALAGLLIYRRFRGEPLGGAALAGMIVFLLHPTIVLQTFMEFHELALAPLPLVGLVLAHERRSLGGAALCAAALATIREDNALVLATLGVLALFEARNRRLAMIELGFAALLVAAYVGIGVHLLGHDRVPSVFAAEYGQWGATPVQAAVFVATHPLAVVRHLASRPVLSYGAQILAPFLGILPFRSALSLAGVPSLLLNLFSAVGSRQLQPRMHYSVAPVSMFAVAMMKGMQRSRLGPLLCWLACALTVATVPVWALRARQRANPYRAEVRRVLAVLPDSASVAAPGYMLGELAARPTIGFVWREGVTRLDYVVVEDADRKFYPGTSVDTFYTPALGAALHREGYVDVPVPHGWHVFHQMQTPRIQE
jgi:uncharacterized membrane protein